MLVLFVMLVFVIGTAEKLPPVYEPDGVEEYTEEMEEEFIAEIEQDIVDTIKADEQERENIAEDIAEIDALFTETVDDKDVVKDQAYFDSELAEAIALYEAEEKAQLLDWESEPETEVISTHNDNINAQIQEDELTIVDELMCINDFVSQWIIPQYLEY